MHEFTNVRMYETVKQENAVQEMKYLMLQKDLENHLDGQDNKRQSPRKNKNISNVKTGNNTKKTALGRPHHEGFGR